jgi:hypothetical protein
MIRSVFEGYSSLTCRRRADQAVTGVCHDLTVSRSPTGATPRTDRVPLRCATCGALLDDDPDEDPTGDRGQPICGECERSRNFDADLPVMDEEDRG